MKTLDLNGVTIKWLGHSSFMIEHDGKVVYIDPYKVSDISKKADVIFITHGHYDHCSIGDIQNLSKDDTILFIPVDSFSKVSHRVNAKEMILMKPGDEKSLDWLQVSAIPAYNLTKEFHPKENQWMGYVFSINGISFYHAGDTDKIPEMASVKCDVMLVPVGGTYTMGPKEAAEAVSIVRPKLAIPMHYGSIVGSESDAKTFKNLCSLPVRIFS